MKIGIFDSGIGGLTVFRQLMKKLPNSDYVYLGDTARLPYGIKSRKTVVEYSIKNTQFLINKGCIPIISLVSPYIDLRDEFKSKYNVLEVYLHTSETRGREDYFVKDYEPPIKNFLDMDTTYKTEEESLDEILNVYR